MQQPIIGLLAFSVTARDTLYYGTDATYIRTIVSHGGIPLLIPPGTDNAGISTIIRQIDGLLVPGGTDISPERYGETPRAPLMPADPALESIEFPLVRRAYELDLPVLGICRGNQTLAVALGGDLYQDLRTDIGTGDHSAPNGAGWAYHEIEIKPESQVESILGCTSVLVNSWHHQAVRTVPNELAVVATSSDGIIEGIEAPEKEFFMGVQCHPEELWDKKTPQFGELFRAFVDAAAARAVARDKTVADRAHGTFVTPQRR